MNKDKLYIFDTTLRDGAQTQGVDFSIDDKQKISEALDSLGVDYIEGGWPGANPTDTEFFNKDHNFKNAKLTAFGMTKKSEHSANNDPMLSSLINSKSSSNKLIVIFFNILFLNSSALIMYLFSLYSSLIQSPLSFIAAKYLLSLVNLFLILK